MSLPKPCDLFSSPWEALRRWQISLCGLLRACVGARSGLCSSCSSSTVTLGLWVSVPKAEPWLRCRVPPGVCSCLGVSGVCGAQLVFRQSCSRSLLLGKLVSPKAGSVGGYRTCQGTSCPCLAWKRVAWAPVGIAVNLYYWASWDLHHLQTCLSKRQGFGLRNSQQAELPVWQTPHRRLESIRVLRLVTSNLISSQLFAFFFCLYLF